MSVGDYRAVLERMKVAIEAIDGVSPYHYDLTDPGVVQYGLAPVDAVGHHDVEVWITSITPRSTIDPPLASLGCYARHLVVELFVLVKGTDIEDRTLKALDAFQDIQRALELDSKPSTGSAPVYDLAITDAAVITPELLADEYLGAVVFTVQYRWATDIGAVTGTG